MRKLALAALICLFGIGHALAQSPCVAGYLACGQDFSANQAAIPLPGYVLIATVPATARASIEVQNQSTSLIQLVRDDGFGNQQSTIMLAPAATAGGQGASWSSTTFRGRLRVYAPSSTAQVAVYQE
jgi:hypothetical protein